MDAYTGFAGVYDLFMDNIPYEEWCSYVCKLLRKNKITDGIVLDLGCGTGVFTRLLSASGYDMIGIDNAPDMLTIAKEQQSESGSDILYLLQDMREFELYGTVAAVVSICDSMNYITDEKDLLQVFKLVNNYLDPGGLFIFDLNTEYKYREVLGDSVIAENREEGSFIWENEYDETTKMNEYALTLFVKENELYRKYEELHIQRAYSLETIRSLLAKAGMEFVAVYDAFTEEPMKTDSERIYVLAREHGK